MSFIRHCEPTGRANARPLTGSAKQSMSPRKGRMDCFVASLLAMTVDAVLRSRGAMRPKFFKTFSPKRGSRECRVHAAPAVSCANSAQKTHTSIQVQSEHSGIPCAMALRLMPCSPWRRIPLASIAAGLMARPIRLDRFRHRQLDTSHGCQNHTVLPYASASYVLRDVSRSRVAPPCSHLPRRRLASTASRLAFVTIAIRPSCRDGTARK